MASGTTHRALAAAAALAVALLSGATTTHAEPPATAAPPSRALLERPTEAHPQRAGVQPGGSPLTVPLTRAAERRQLRSIDAGAWLERFGSVQQRRIAE